jgi:hypothetical protein
MEKRCLRSRHQDRRKDEPSVRVPRSRRRARVNPTLNLVAREVLSWWVPASPWSAWLFGSPAQSAFAHLGHHTEQSRDDSR